MCPPSLDLAFTPNGFEAFLAFFDHVRDFTAAIEEPGLITTGVGFPRATVMVTPDGRFRAGGELPRQP